MNNAETGATMLTNTLYVSMQSNIVCDLLPYATCKQIDWNKWNIYMHGTTIWYVYSQTETYTYIFLCVLIITFCCCKAPLNCTINKLLFLM